MRPFQQITLTAPLKLWCSPRFLRWFPLFIIEAKPFDESLRAKIEEQIAKMKSRNLAAVIVLPHPADWQPIKFGPFETQIGTTWHNPERVFTEEEKSQNADLSELARKAFPEQEAVFEVFHAPHPQISSFISLANQEKSPEALAKIFGEPVSKTVYSGIYFWTFYLGIKQINSFLHRPANHAGANISIFIDGAWRPYDESYPAPKTLELPFFVEITPEPKDFPDHAKRAIEQYRAEARAERLKEIRRKNSRGTLAQTVGAGHKVKRRSAWRGWLTSWLQTPTNAAQLEMNRLGISIKTSSGRMADN